MYVLDPSLIVYVNWVLIKVDVAVFSPLLAFSVNSLYEADLEYGCNCGNSPGVLPRL
jgi:hypothetical protein